MLLLSAFALLAAPAVADGGNGRGHGPWSDGGGETTIVPGQDDGMYEKGAKTSLMGKMNYSYGYGRGSFVFYTLDEANGTLTDYGLLTSGGEKVLIANITVEGFDLQEIEVHGSIVRLSDGGLIAVIHDNPTGMYHLFVDEAANVSIVLAGNMTVVENRVQNETSDLTYQLVIADGASRGVIASDDPFLVSENGTVVTCTVTEHLMIRFLPQVAHRHQWIELALMQAVREGRVAAEVTLVGGEEGGVYDTVSYCQELQVQVQEVAKNRFRLNAHGENAQGALVLVHTETGTMDMSQDRLRVRLNAQEMCCVEDPLELLYGQPEDACYAVVDDGEVQQMLVYLPASTVGALTVESVDPMDALLSPGGVAIIIGAIALVALAGVVAFRKR